MIVLLKLQGHIPPSRKQGNFHMAWNPLGYILETRTNSMAPSRPQGWWARECHCRLWVCARAQACIYVLERLRHRERPRRGGSESLAAPVLLLSRHKEVELVIHVGPLPLTSVFY